MPKLFKKDKKTKKRKFHQSNIDENLIEKRKNEIIGILIIAFAALSAISIFTNTAGFIGRKMAEIYFFLIGYGSYVIPLILLVWGITLIRLKGLRINSRVIGFMFFYISTITLIHTYQYFKFPLESALIGQGGGIVAGSLSWVCTKLFGYIGSYIVLAAVILIGLLLWFDVFLISLIQYLKTSMKSIGKWFSSLLLKMKRKKHIDNIKKETELNHSLIEDDNNLFDIPEKENDNREIVEIDSFDNSLSKMDLDNNNYKKKNEKKNRTNTDHEPIADEKISKDTKTLKVEKREYRLPALNLLKDTNKNRQKPGNKSTLLEDTLQSFGVNARVIKVNHGPTITRYEIQPASGVKVSKIVNLADDIALALAAPGVRIEAPIPGKAAVGVEVPHMKNITIGLKDVISSNEFLHTNDKIPLALGMGIDGKPIVIDLSQMPHVLVAGATGSGKSVCINTIIASILYKSKPEEVKLILIDPKKVELSSYNDLPHLFAPVVSDPKKAAGILKLVVEEMENRYELFSINGTRNIESYNKKLPGEEHLPYIVVIIDELSDLMMVAAHDVEDNICRLAQMARAAGIHLVIATQRPSVDVITGLIKANIPSRISFAVSSQTDSRTILDTGGAEKLLGKGDMLLYPTGTQKPQRVQGAFITNEEINALVNFVKKQADPDFSFDVDDINIIKIEMENDDERDELYKEAIKLVVNYRASISMLQRRLHIGHSRAARMIDMMEEDGIVGPYAGSKAREVMLTKEELDVFFSDGKWRGEDSTNIDKEDNA